jgi:hypothetical protein
MHQTLGDGPTVRAQLALQRALSRTDVAPTQSGAPQHANPPVEKPNATGLPDGLKVGIEHLSGLSMDDVRVHYNSPMPATVQAHAYAQGSAIHIAPGQDKHLPHEAWHVVQQKQGRVKPKLQLKGLAINDDAALEREADVMGARAKRDAQMGQSSPSTEIRPSPHLGRRVVQRKFDPSGKTYKLVASNSIALGRINAASFESKLNGKGYPTEAKVTAINANGGDSDTAALVPQDYDKWFAKRVLLDQTPWKVQSLTKMHAINSHLYGPNHTRNLFLGTSSSNDYHSETVENPIKSFVGERGGFRHIAEYTVEPIYGVTLEHYNMKLAGSAHADKQLTQAEYKEFQDWAALSIAAKVRCKATYYKLNPETKELFKSDTADELTFDADLSEFKKSGGWTAGPTAKKKDPLGLKEGKRRRRKKNTTSAAAADSADVTIDDDDEKDMIDSGDGQDSEDAAMAGNDSN